MSVGRALWPCCVTLRPKVLQGVSALLLRMLREGKIRSTFRNIQDGSLSA